MDPKELIPGCSHFTWKDALWLPKYNCLHIPSEIEKQNIIKTALLMEKIREYLNSPIIIHIWIRPILNNPESPFHGQDYNILVGGAEHSAHKIGLAVDYHATLLNCSEAKAKLVSKLAEFNMRLEKDTTNWIHSDLYPPNPNRYF